MKKFLSLLFVIVFTVGLVGCSLHSGNGSDPDMKSGDPAMALTATIPASMFTPSASMRAFSVDDYKVFVDKYKLDYKTQKNGFYIFEKKGIQASEMAEIANKQVKIFIMNAQNIIRTILAMMPKKVVPVVEHTAVNVLLNNDETLHITEVQDENKKAEATEENKVDSEVIEGEVENLVAKAICGSEELLDGSTISVNGAVIEIEFNTATTNTPVQVNSLEDIDCSVEFAWADNKVTLDNENQDGNGRLSVTASDGKLVVTASNSLGYKGEVKFSINSFTLSDGEKVYTLPATSYTFIAE